MTPAATRTPSRRRPYAARVPREQRRAQLLDAALAVIQREGYAGVSVDAIAREADVTRPVVYGIFDGLGALLSALLDRQQARLSGQVLGILGDLESGVGHVVRGLVAAVVADPAAWRPVLTAGDGTPPRVRERIDADRERVRVVLAGQLREHLGARADPRLDADVLGHALLGIAEHFGRLLVERPDDVDPDALAETVEGLVETLTSRAG